MMEKMAGAVIDDIQAAAPVVKRIAGDIADSLPIDSILGKQIEMIENIAEDIEEEANKAEIWLDKVYIILNTTSTQDHIMIEIIKYGCLKIHSSMK